jgi:hypothetical protein
MAKVNNFSYFSEKSGRCPENGAKPQTILAYWRQGA